MYTKEVWKDIPNYEGYYQVNIFGEIKSLERTNISKDGKPLTKHSIILKHSVHKGGYHLVNFSKNNKKEVFLVHRLVAKAFIPNPENKPEVNHIDGNKNNNTVYNLEWVNRSENMRHRIDVLGFKGGLYGKLGKLNSRHKVVQQIQDGKIIAEYYGSHEAERITGISSGSIRSACRGEHKTAGGFLWKYKIVEK